MHDRTEVYHIQLIFFFNKCSYFYIEELKSNRKTEKNRKTHYK